MANPMRPHARRRTGGCDKGAFFYPMLTPC